MWKALQAIRFFFTRISNAVYETGFTNPIDEAIRTHRSFDLSGNRKADEIPYDFLRKRLSILVAHQETYLMVTKGALANVLSACSTAETSARAVADIATVRERIQQHFEAFSSQGIGVLSKSSNNSPLPTTLAGSPRVTYGNQTTGPDSHKDVIRNICSALFMPFVFAAMAARVATSDSSSPKQWLKEAEAAYGNVTSYTAIFHKQQRVAGKLLPEETILIKFKKPFSVYMRWVRAPYKGSELLYVEGWNGNRIRAHRGGILRFVTRNLDPRDPALMADNLRPVTSTGIGFLLETVAINIRKAIDASELMFSEGAEETVYGRKTQVFDMVFPKHSAKNYDAYRLVINQDVESKILIRIRTYDRDGQLVEN